MIKIPSMLIIGATSKNAGKTKLACSLIKKFSSRCSIIGIKVTVTEETDGGWHPTVTGSIVQSRVEGSHCITEETDSQVDKDTSQMLASGAKRVFWLQVWRTHLEEGIAALLKVVGDDAVTICESNSFRQVVEPGLFLMVTDSRGGVCKPSAQNVVKHVDRTVSFDGKNLDINLDEIEFTNGRWVLKMAAAQP